MASRARLLKEVNEDGHRDHDDNNDNDVFYNPTKRAHSAVTCCHNLQNREIAVQSRYRI